MHIFIVDYLEFDKHTYIQVTLYILRKLHLGLYICVCVCVYTYTLYLYIYMYSIKIKKIGHEFVREQSI